MSKEINTLNWMHQYPRGPRLKIFADGEHRQGFEELVASSKRRVNQFQDLKRAKIEDFRNEKIHV